MFQFNIELRMALATNMFALIFMSAGASLPFLRGEQIDRKRILAGSLIGAFLLLIPPSGSVPLVVSMAMIGVSIFSLIYGRAGVHDAIVPPTMCRGLRVSVYIRFWVFTAAFSARLCNGIVDYRLGIIFGMAMFAGALIGSRLAIRLGNEWLRRIYLTV